MAKKVSEKTTEESVITLLSEYLGVELEDIHLEDTFLEDLHISPADLAEFIETLETKGYSTSKLNLEEIETVGDLVEHLNVNSEI